MTAALTPTGCTGNEQAAARLVAGDRFAICPLAFGCEPFDKANAVKDFSLGLCKGLALFRSQDRGEITGMSTDELRPGQDNLTALTGKKNSPGPEGILGRVDRLIKHLYIAIADMGNFITGCRVSDSGRTFGS